MLTAVRRFLFGGEGGKPEFRVSREELAALKISHPHRPANTTFKQQAWDAKLNCITRLDCAGAHFVFVALYCLIGGGVLLAESSGLQGASLAYACPVGPCPCNGVLHCNVSLDLPAATRHPAVLQYQLDDFYPNHYYWATPHVDYRNVSASRAAIFDDVFELYGPSGARVGVSWAEDFSTWFPPYRESDPSDSNTMRVWMQASASPTRRNPMLHLAPPLAAGRYTLLITNHYEYLSTKRVLINEYGPTSGGDQTHLAIVCFAVGSTCLLLGCLMLVAHLLTEPTCCGFRVLRARKVARGLTARGRGSAALADTEVGGWFTTPVQRKSALVELELERWLRHEASQTWEAKMTRREQERLERENRDRGLELIDSYAGAAAGGEAGSSAGSAGRTAGPAAGRSAASAAESARHGAVETASVHVAIEDAGAGVGLGPGGSSVELSSMGSSSRVDEPGGDVDNHQGPW